MCFFLSIKHNKDALRVSTLSLYWFYLISILPSLEGGEDNHIPLDLAKITVPDRALAGLGFTVQTQASLKTQRSTCLYLPTDGIKGVYHHAQPSKKFIYLYAFVFCLHVCLCEDVRSHESRVTDSCELPCRCWELNQVLWKSIQCS